MKILHTALIKEFSSGSGIINQMYDESESAKDLGIDFEVKLFAPKQNIPIKYNKIFEFCDLDTSKNKFSLWFGYRKAYYQWLESKSENVDCYILRYSTYDYLQYLFIKRIKKPVYLVHHTKELEELSLLGVKGKIASLLDRFFGNQSIRYSAGVIGVTKEIIEYEKLRINNLSKHSILYPNGIKVKDQPLLDKRTKAIPEILFIASYFYDWHGLDLLISAAGKSEESFLIHIVGEVNEIDAESLKKDKRFIYHSSLTTEEIFEISKQCWIALGSFALFRKSLNEGSTLKVREYLSNGLPVYSGHIDSFPVSFKFYKYSALDMDKILSFAYDMRAYDKNYIKKSSEVYVSKKNLLRELYNNLIINLNPND